jgi:hypothetical protein
MVDFRFLDIGLRGMEPDGETAVHFGMRQVNFP